MSAWPGHPGWHRKKPDKIDKVIEAKSSCWPHCGNKHITPCKKAEEHIQEDTVLPMVKATLYRSLSGVKNHNIIMSRLKTVLFNGLNLFDAMKEILVDPGKSRIDALIRAP